MIKLGSKVRDVVDGYEGIASARSEHLDGRTLYLVERHTNSPMGCGSAWIGELRLEVIGNNDLWLEHLATKRLIEDVDNATATDNRLLASLDRID